MLGNALTGGIAPEQRRLLGGRLHRHQGFVVGEDGAGCLALSQRLIEIGYPAVVVGLRGSGLTGHAGSQ